MIIKQKGTYDIKGLDAKKREYVRSVIDALCEKYNYNFISTPIFESSELFHRGIGNTTDIVTKETYDFKDRGDRDLTLRPEGTAGVVRSFIEDKMYGGAISPSKFYYYGKMFRYERPQSGRNREFTQFGVEAIGSNDPAIDAEVISLAVNLLKLLGLKNIKVNINSLGDAESRDNYRKVLIDYFKKYEDDLCSDCKERLEKNPLRVLDCKVDSDKEFFKNAPKTIDYLNEESKTRFEEVTSYLDILDIDYVINPRIVRGLDYYNHTVFEIEATVKDFGSQNVLAAGGRYNGLVSMLDGPDTPGIGFACGIDRLILALDKEEVNYHITDTIDAYILYVNEVEKAYAVGLLQELRVNGISAEMDYCSRSLKSQFKDADRYKSRFMIILNSDDIAAGEVKVKDTATKEEKLIKEEEVIDYFDMNL